MILPLLSAASCWVRLPDQEGGLMARRRGWVRVKEVSVKTIFVLAVLAALWLSMPASSEAQVGDDLYVQTEGQSGTLKAPRLFDQCEVVDGNMECTVTLQRNMPIAEYRLLACEPEGENCILLKTIPGENSCYGLPRGEVKDCTWGSGLTYTLVATIGIDRSIDAEYSHVLQETYLGTDAEGNPRYGNVGKQRGMAILDRECKRIMREMARTGDYGPVPECAVN